MRASLLALCVLTAGILDAAEPPKGPRLIEKPDAFPTLVNPKCSHCRDEARRRKGELKDADRVLCWIRGRYEGGAIPFRFFLDRYRVISDTYGVFVYDPDAGYARGFEASLDFRFHGWHKGVMVMKHKDGTLFSCLSGRGIAGPRKGALLNPIPTLVSDWGFWMKHYPHTVAYHMFDKYKPLEAPVKPSAGSKKSRGRADPRLAAETPVLGVTWNDKAKAYPLDVLARAGLVHDKIAGRDCVILWYGPTKTAAAYFPEATIPGKDMKPVPVKLKLDKKVPDAPFLDETGARWDVAGRGVSPGRQGWVLTWVPCTQVKWFAWAAEYPATALANK